MKKYYVHDGTQQAGPFDIEDLKSKNLKNDTPIWYEGLSEWTILGNIEELKGVLAATPPVFASKTITPPPILNPTIQETTATNTTKSGSSTGRRLLKLAGLITIILLGVYIYNQIQQQQYLNNRQNTINAEEDKKALIRNLITSYVTAERNEYTYSQLGGIWNLKITVSNTSDYIIDNVKVKVTYIKADGGIWDTKIVDFNLLDPRSKTTIKVDDSPRGTSIQYEIVSIKSAALGMN